MIVALLALACTGPGDTGPGVVVEPPMAVVATVADDYASGALSLVSLEDLAVQDGVLPTTGDPQVVVEGGVAYLLERDAASSLSAWDPTDWSEPRWEEGVGANPHDVARCGEHLFVSLYDEDHLEVRDPDTGLRVGKVRLDAFADGDGLPEASGLVVAGGHLYVALHQFDREAEWAPAGGLVAEVDCDALEVERTWSPGPAPDLFPHPSDPGALVVRTGAWWVPDGALGSLHPDEGPDGVLGEPWLTEADLDEEDLMFFAGTAEGSVVVSAREGEYSVVRCLDPAGAPTGEVQVESALWAALADDRGRVWTPARASWADPDAPVGLVLWDPVACAEEQRVHTELAPYHLGFAL